MFNDADAVLAEYELLDSLVNEIEFGAGVITFSETTIQLQVTTATAGCTPLVVPVDSLTLFKLFPGNRIVLHTVSDLLHLWMMTNELEWMPPCTPTGDAELQLLLQPEDMVDFKTNVAPVIAQKRKARSSSRWSATSLLRIKPFAVALTTQSATGAAASLPPLPQLLPMSFRSPSYHHHHENTAQEHQQHQQQHKSSPNNQLHRAADVAVARTPSSVTRATLAPCQPDNAPTAVQIDAVESNPAVQIVRSKKKRLVVTPDSNSLPSSVCPESPTRNTSVVNAVATKKGASPLAVGNAAPVERSQIPSTDHDDVPLGQLLFSSRKGGHERTGAKTSCGPRRARSPVQPVRSEPENVQYDFCDLSSPRHMALAAPQPQPASRKRTGAPPPTSTTAQQPKPKPVARAAAARQPKGSKRAAVPISKPHPLDGCEATRSGVPSISQEANPAHEKKLEARTCSRSAAVTGKSKENTEAPQQLQQDAGNDFAALSGDAVAGEEVEAELTFDHDASKFYFPLAASVARTSVSAVRPPPAGLVVADDEVSEIKALLCAGVGEENIEEFLKSAARLGRRVKEAKRKRAESCAHLSTEALSGIATLAQDLLHKCASERNGRRSKFFRFYTRTLSALQEKAVRIAHECTQLQMQQRDFTRDIEQLISSLTEDELRWGTVEEKDVLASISSIHDSLLGAAHQTDAESAVRLTR